MTKSIAIWVKQPASWSKCRAGSRTLFSVLALALAMSIGRGFAADAPAGSSGSLHIWEDTPEYPRIETPPEGDSTTAKKKTNATNNAKTKLADVSWDAWALPIGNGRLGAVFWGKVADELIQFNEDSLWTGDDQKSTLKREGDKRPTNFNYGSYQPFGDIHIFLPHEKFTDYRRDLDLSRAVGTVTYKSGGVTYRREYFASYPDQAIVIRLSADQPGSISGSVQLADKHFAKLTTVGNTVTARGKLDEKLYISRKFSEIAYGTPEQIANAKNVWAGNNLKYEEQMRVMADCGTLIPGADGEFKVTNATSVTILLAAGTEYLAEFSKQWRGEDPHAKVTQQIEAAAKRSYEELLARHVADYQSLFNRLQLDLGKSDPGKTALPMHKRLAEFRKDADDPELITLMANFGRYLLISSSRPGGLPANLQGLWNPERYSAPWAADYHLNINLQMNYWQTGPGNLSECDEPLIYWLQSVMPVLERETKEELGKPGWAAGWGVNLFGNGSVDKKVEGAWICWHLYENYRFTHDTNLLARVSFPIIREAVNFWTDTLIETNGVLLAPAVQSPEWGPTEDGVLYAQEIVWELFSEYIELADVLGTDKTNRDKVAVMRDKLATPKIGSHGEVMEWHSEKTSSQMWGKEHRHVSHLVGLFPGRQISPLTTPDLAKAAAVSLEQRGDGYFGWSEIFRAGMWARLLEGDKAISLVESFIRAHVWPSGMSSIGAGASTGNGDKFQIDANLGCPDVIYEMLLQSQSGAIHLLPALPAKFPTGSVRGLRARDGFVVDMTWDKGQLTRAVIHSTWGNSCNVRYGDKSASFEIKLGSNVVLDKALKVVE